MKILRIFILSLLLITTPTLLAYPQVTFHIQKASIQERPPLNLYDMSYDQIMQLLGEIESDEVEQKYTPEEQERIVYFIASLAEEGALPDNSSSSTTLSADVQELLSDSNYQYAFANGNYGKPIIGIATFSDQAEITLCKSWMKKQWKKAKHFVKKHKKEIIIGAVIVVAVTVVVVAVVAVVAASASTAAAAGAAAAGAASSAKSDHTPEPKENFSSAIGSSETPLLKSELDQQIFSFKESIVSEQFFADPSAEKLSWQETGKVLGPVFAQDTFNHLSSQCESYPRLAQEVQTLKAETNFSRFDKEVNPQVEIGRKFPTNDSPEFLYPGLDFNSLSHLEKGRRECELKLYPEAIKDFDRAIELNPTQPYLFLERSHAHFKVEDYESMLQDFNQYTTLAPDTPAPESFSYKEFGSGFVKGLPDGIKDSGQGMLLLVSDIVIHPIHTAKQMLEGLTLLSELTRSNEWREVSKVLAPEIYDLATNWHNLTSERRGELAGYVLGKYGADILIPGALVKAGGKTAQAARGLQRVCDKFKIAERMLPIEAAAGLGSSVEIAEAVQASQKTIAMGKELGIPVKEMAQLKQAGKLEGAINEALGNVITKKSFRIEDLQGELLANHLRQVKRYGSQGFRQLENNKIRYYDVVKPPITEGEMIGRRVVREWDPQTGMKRTWNETLDGDNNVRFVRPQRDDGIKKHYTFDRKGKFRGIR